jgi:DHA3 family macrolide efflux protein-like MFS transporter
MKRYVTLFRENRTFRVLTVLQLLNYTGGWFTVTAIFTLLVQLGAEPFWIGLIGASHFLAGIIQAPLIGVISDRFPPKRLFLILIGVEIFATTLLLFADSPELIPVIFVLVFLRMGSASFYFNLEMTLLPKVVDSKKLQIANEVHTISWSLTYVLGTALGGIGVSLFGVTPVILIDILLYIVSFFVMWNLKLDIEFSKSGESFLSMLKGGVVYLKRNSRLIHIILLHSFVGFATYEALITIASERFFSSVVSVAIGIGFTHSIRAFAILISPMILGKFVSIKALPFLFIFQGVSLFIWSYFVDNFYWNLLGAFLSGAVIGSIWSYTYTLLQQGTDEKFYGRVIAYNDMVFLTVASLTAFFSGKMVGIGFSIPSVLVFMGVLFLVGAVYTVWIFRDREEERDR